ncbi:S-layer homology domain-containing protein [Paenibacillus sp. CMAA1364]
MKKLKGLLCLMLIMVLTFGFAGQITASNNMNDEYSNGDRGHMISEFGDLKDAQWAAGYITNMKSKKVIEGFEDGTFRPNQPVTRVQAIVTAVRLMDLENEAKLKSPDTKLHFKDAHLLDSQFPWAKGYVIVALEHGLFDATEDRIQPNTPASRVWVSSLLVKSLGLQAEALKQMTKTPDFKDKDAIPAGAVGYVNVAVERGVVSGYPDGTFKPNKNVTRAEMAALLERTNDGILENIGAITVNGIIKDIKFTPNHNNSANNDVSKNLNGEIKIEMASKELRTYKISSELLVPFQHKIIRADQLAINDNVSLVVQDGKVIQGKLLLSKEPGKEEDTDKTDKDTTSLDIVEFELEVELSEKAKLELEYKNKQGKSEAKVEKEFKNDKEKLKGKDAVDYIEALLAKVKLTDKMNQKEALSAILAGLNIEKDDVVELELEVKFKSGKQLKVEIDNDDDDDEDDED